MQSSSHFRIFSTFLTGFFCLHLVACSTLPQHSSRYNTNSTTDISPKATASTAFLRLNQPLQQYPDLTGYHLLSHPDDALATRLALIENAQKNLDIQYYIWNNDHIGQLFFYHLIQAANRGVHVRLLIDDNNSQAIEGTLLALAQHPNIEVKLFNPYRFRKYRQWDMLLNVRRINRRMHNKTVIADGKLSIIGGRNIGNEYFNVSDDFQFADIDILLAGQAHYDIAQSFQDYWQDPYAFEVRDIVNHRRHTLRYPELVQQLTKFYHQHQKQFYHIQNDTYHISHWLQHDLSLTWVNGQALIDPVAKVRKQANTQDYVYPQLLKQAQQPQQYLDIISAYFIPRQTGTKLLTDWAKSGVDIRILTNSFASNDVEFVHSFYSPYRKALLDSGIALYEFLPITQIEQFMDSDAQISPNHVKNVPKADLIKGGSSHASLHAKTITIDKKQVFIGSMNLDPRSVIYNTELGVLLDSPQLAQHLHYEMQHNLENYAWQLQLDENQNIIWTLPQTQPDLILTQEPQMTWWQKTGLTMFSWLPVESLF